MADLVASNQSRERELKDLLDQEKSLKFEAVMEKLQAEEKEIISEFKGKERQKMKQKDEFAKQCKGVEEELEAVKSRL